VETAILVVAPRAQGSWGESWIALSLPFQLRCALKLLHLVLDPIMVIVREAHMGSFPSKHPALNCGSRYNWEDSSVLQGSRGLLDHTIIVLAGQVSQEQQHKRFSRRGSYYVVVCFGLEWCTFRHNGVERKL
jgi:hypothetical protein